MTTCAFDEFLDTIDWEATEEKHQTRFFDYVVLENGIHNEDYILDNYAELFLDFAINELSPKDFVCVNNNIKLK